MWGLCVRFDEDFARLSADDFADKLLAGRIKAKAVVVGMISVLAARAWAT